MIWSFSDSRTFAKCQRRWYYDAVVAYWTQKDPRRWEAYLLSKLQTVSAWRGQVVDTAVTTTLVPAMNNRVTPDLQRCLGRARHLFDGQRAFAMRHRLRDAGMVPSKAGETFAAFLPIEFGEPVTEAELDRAWAEVEQAIRNLFGMTALLDELRAATLCIAQRPLTFDHGGISVRALPDLVAFYDGFYGQSPLDRQYLILPKSIADSWGTAFRADLARAVNDFFPQEAGYSPVVVTYTTAFLTARLPHPELALPLLTDLGIAEPSPDDSLKPSRALVGETGPRSLDRFGPAFGRRVFERLLLLPAFSGPLQLALSHVPLGHGALTVSWSAVPRKDQSNPGWLWLQQLGLMTHTGSEVTFDPALRPFVLDAPPTKRRMSQAELDVRLRLQQERAALTEEYVLRLERDRLRAAGMGELADEAVRVSVDDVMAGFDIRSFELTGAPRHIEVKSSAGPRLFFVLTRNEYETACEKQDSYWIAWVGGASNLPSGPCEVAWYQNPAPLLHGHHPAWEVSHSDLVIQRSGDDSAYQAHHDSG